MNKHIKRKIFYNNNGNGKRKKNELSNIKSSNIDYSHGFPKGCSVTKEENAFLLRINGKKRARFFFPITLEEIKKYASAYIRYVKEFKLKV